MTLIQRDESQTIGEAAAAAYFAVPYVRYGLPGHDEYVAAQSVLDAEFKALLHEEHSLDFPDSLHERIYEIAYSQGHSSGFESIEHEYAARVGFAREVLAHFDIAST